MKANEILAKLTINENLAENEAEEVMDQLMEGQLTHAQMGALLTALHMKGETPQEILGFIYSMRNHMEKVEVEGVVIDTCGTGGDAIGTFNISTAVALVAVGAGVKVAKHGNRAACSKCGSADVLESFGVNINLTPRQATELLQDIGITFLFAPLYHPAIKYVIPVRREMKIRTVFNFLGPFVNPASVRRQLVGVSDLAMAAKLAAVASKLDYDHLLIVTSQEGMDEISISSPTHIYEISHEEIVEGIIEPEDYGLSKASLEDVTGGTVQQNAAIIREILAGRQGPKTDIVVLNSAAALYVAGRVKNIVKGLELARQSLMSGAAAKILDELVKKSQSYLSV